MAHSGRLLIRPIYTAAILQIPTHVLWVLGNILGIAKHPRRSHAHDEMLQDVAVEHPDTRICDASADAAPSELLISGTLSEIPIKEVSVMREVDLGMMEEQG
jgi:hypothetical protein